MGGGGRGGGSTGPQCLQLTPMSIAIINLPQEFPELDPLFCVADFVIVVADFLVVTAPVIETACKCTHIH